MVQILYVAAVVMIVGFLLSPVSNKGSRFISLLFIKYIYICMYIYSMKYISHKIIYIL